MRFSRILLGMRCPWMRFAYTLSMSVTKILKLFVPNRTSLGYAIFTAVSAAGIWGGVFPFLPLGFQTRDIVFWFYLCQSLACTLAYLASFVGVYRWPRFPRDLLAKVSCIPYFLGWCCLIGAIYLHGNALVLTAIGGALLGVGSVGFYIVWQRLFAAEDPDAGSRDIFMGTAYGALFYYGLYLIPEAVTAYLIPLVFLPLFALSAQLKSREIDLNQPMFEDVPKEHPHVYVQVMRDHWAIALCIGAIGFCAGVMRAMVIAEPVVGSLVNLFTMVCVLVAMVGLTVVWFFNNIRLDISTLYRLLFPFLITAFIAVPFLPDSVLRWAAAMLYAINIMAIVLMMMHCAQVSRDRGISPIFVYAFFGTIVYTLQNVGFIGGTFAENVRLMGVPPEALVALISVYALALMFFIGSGGLSEAFGRSEHVESIELMAISRMPVRTPALVREHREGDAATAGAPLEEEPVLEGTPAGALDRIPEKARSVQEAYRLSARETEVMELIARGNSVARIAEMLVVSENTIRTHSKRIYAKLGIHKKQELIDLMDAF